MNFNRVIITGDFSRVEYASGKWRYGQFKNISWLYSLLKPVLEAAFDVPVDYWPKTEYLSKYELALLERIYESKLEPECIDIQWARRSKNKLSSDIAKGLLGDKFAGALVISLETPDFLIDFCEAENIAYVDLIFHPVRFMPDLMFGMRSPAFSRHISNYAVEDLIISSEAALISAYHRRKENKSYFGGASNAMLLLGQMDIDRSLIEDGRFMSIDEYADQLRTIAKPYDLVFYKPHPYMINSPAKLNYLADIIKKMDVGFRITSVDYYWLLSQDQISDVFAISSGGVVEAGYFGKNGRFLKDYPWDINWKNSSRTYYPIMSVFMAKKFWIDAFCEHDEPETSCFGADYWLSRRNIIRKSLIQSWGFSLTDIGSENFLFENDRKNSKSSAENCARLVRLVNG